MYTTVQQCHVALDYEIQQINSNRKQAINPAYYDMALNEAVLQFIETRSSNKSNLKHEGFEESEKRYDDLKNLKRQRTFDCLVDTDYYQRGYIIFPSNYLKYTPSEVIISYNKQGLSTPVKAERSYSVMVYDLSKIVYPFPTTSSFKVGVGADQVDISNLLRIVKSDRGKFYAINLIIDKLRNIGYEAYYETFNGEYKHESLYVVSPLGKSLLTPITATNIVGVSSKIILNVFDSADASQPSTHQSSIELLPTSAVRDVLNNYHGSRNRHSNPVADIIEDHLNIYYNDNFIPLKVILTYIKRPRLIDLNTNTMCEITVPQEVIKLAVLHLKGILKDEGYNISANEKIINE